MCVFAFEFNRLETHLERQATGAGLSPPADTQGAVAARVTENGSLARLPTGRSGQLPLLGPPVRHGSGSPDMQRKRRGHRLPPETGGRVSSHPTSPAHGLPSGDIFYLLGD